MARPTKQGLDYFPLDVGFLQNVKVRRIMRACGIQSIPVLISLLANTYREEGYFLRWDNDMPFLIADELGVSEGAVTAVVDKATQVGFFNANMYEKYGVLTSDGIQKRFFEATARRTSVRYDARFLLINVSDCKNIVNVYKNSINDDDNQQSKVKESKYTTTTTTTADRYAEAIQCYQDNIRPISGGIELEKVQALIDEAGTDLFVKAVDRAVFRDVRNLQYITGILRDWMVNGYDEEGDGKNGGTAKSGEQQRPARKAHANASAGRKKTDGSETDWDSVSGWE